MIPPTILAAAAKVAEHSARRSTPWGVSEGPSFEHRLLDAPVPDNQDLAAATGCLPILGNEHAKAAPPSSRRLIRKHLELVSTPTR